MSLKNMDSNIHCKKRVLFAAPHFDDVVFSVWSYLHKHYEKKTIVTLCGGHNFEENTLSSWDERCGFTKGEQAAKARQIEDLKVCEEVKATAVHLPFLDLPYSSNKSVDEIIDHVAPLILEHDVAFVPIGIGQHKDHINFRDAILTIAENSAIDVYLYADLPYASINLANVPKNRDPQNFCTELSIEQLKSAHKWIKLEESQCIKVRDVNCKLDVASLYESQIAPLKIPYPDLMDVDGSLSIETIWKVARLSSREVVV